MKKIFNKFTKILLLIVMVISDLMTPIKVFADEIEAVTPKKGDVGINETVSNEGSVSVTKGSLDNPGDVMVTKTVKKNGEGKFTVEFEVKGKDAESTTSVQKPIYAVVVFDRSGSMQEINYDKCVRYESFGPFTYCAEYEEVKFSAAVAGAKTFASTLLENFNNAKLALVAFSTRVNTLRNFESTNFDNVNFGSPDGVTNLNGALNTAKELLDSAPANSTKYIVVISDGAPTDGRGNATMQAANQVIATANSIKEDETIKIYSIGYETDETTSATLKAVSSGDDYFMEADSAAVASKFEELAGSITTYADAGTEATITDNIGSSFSVDANSSDLFTVVGSSVSNTDKFDITEEGTKISFDVEINGDEADGWVNVNEGFNLTYTDANGEEKTITYGADEPQPEVYWERNTYNYVINYYKDEITDTSDSAHYLGTSGNLSAFNGDVITLNDTEKNAYLPSAGYELSDSNVYTITIDKTKDNVINVLYEKIDLNYSIKYLFEGDNGYAERSDVPSLNNIGAKYGDEVNAVEKKLANDDIPTGYVFDETKTTEVNNGVYKITDNNTVVNVYYKKQELIYNVRYLFQDLEGNYVPLDGVDGKDNEPAKYGDVISYGEHILNNVPAGYALDTVKSAEVNNGNYVITNNDTTVYVYYKRVNSNFTVNYYFNGDFDKVYSYSNDAIYGSTLTAIDYKLETVNNSHLEDKKNTDNEDYFLDPTDERNNASIVVDATDNNMSLYYISTKFADNSEETTKSTTTEKVTKVDQAVDYTITYKNTINNVREGDVVTVTVTDNLPFEIVEKDSNLVSDGVTGVYNSTNKTITWTFTETIGEFTKTYTIDKTISFSVVYKDFAEISAEKDNNLVNTATGKTTVNNKESNGDTSETIPVPVEINGNLIVHHYEKGTTTSVYSDERTSALVGSDYETNYRTDIIGYTVDTDNMPSNKDGKYAAVDTEVTYYYVKKDGEIENPTTVKSFVREDGQTENVVESVNSTFTYTITGSATIKDYIGTYKVRATDYLPYNLDTTDMEKLDENVYKVNDRCIYDGNMTVVCESVTKDITKDMYDSNKEYKVSETFELSIKYLNIKKATVTNSAKIDVILDNNSKPSEPTTEDVTVKEGSVKAVYLDKNDESKKLEEEYTNTGLVGTSYETPFKPVFGYTLDKEPENKNGTYIDGETLVKYLYNKNKGTFVEDPEADKTGPDSVASINSEFNYTITGSATISDYVGTYKVKVVDTLPYSIDKDKSTLDNRCTYDGKNTITCVSEEKTVTESDYVANEDGEKVFNIEEAFTLVLVYKDITTESVKNSAKVEIILDDNSKESPTSSVETEIKKGTVKATYNTTDGVELAKEVITSGIGGTKYTTEAKEFFGYHLTKMPENSEDVYVADKEILVEYIYELNEGEITNNKVTKEGPKIISDVNDFTEYVITYDGTVKDYIGKATLTVTDTLPYPMGYAGFDYNCDYNDEDNTFTCKVEYDITEEDYEVNEDGEKVFNIHEEFHINVIYGEIDSDVITNTVDSKLELREVFADSDSSVDSKVLKGELVVSYVDEDGNILDSYSYIDYAGSYYETEKREFEGYTFKSSTNNTDGFLVADETTYVEYVYSKNIGTYEELPPQTGIENISVNYIGYIITAFVLFLMGKKRLAKNN